MKSSEGGTDIVKYRVGHTNSIHTCDRKLLNCDRNRSFCFGLVLGREGGFVFVCALVFTRQLILHGRECREADRLDVYFFKSSF